MVSTNSFGALCAHAWPLRYLRSLAASIFSLALAAGGHRLGGGEIASGTVIGSAFVIVFAASWLLSTRQLTTGQIVGLLLIAQLVVHVSCALGGAMTSFGPAMTLGHVFAIALAAWGLVRGERFLWTLADRVGLRALQLFFIRVGVVGPAPRLRISGQDVRAPLRLVLVGGNGLRGPPVGCT